MCQASDWNQLSDLLGLSSNSVNTRIAVKAHARRLGLCIDHLTSSAVVPASPMLQVPADLNELRRAAPSLAMAWFLLRGWTPSVPVEPVVYDFVVSTTEGTKRVQVKSCVRHDARRGGYIVAIAPRRTHGPDRDVAVPYDPDEVDLLFIVDGDGWMYLIELAAVAGKTVLSLNAYRRYRCGNVGALLSTPLGEPVVAA